LTYSDIESALDSKELMAMLTYQRTLLSAMWDFVSDLMDLKTEEKDPRKLLKMLLLDGWIDDKGRITNKDGELTLVFKEVRRFNAQQSMNMIKNLNPDIDKTKLDVAEATSVEELVTATNKSLKLTETVMIKNHYNNNTAAAEKKCNTAKEVVDNSYMQAHNLLLRMTCNAMGKYVKKNKSDIVSVALILTFATEGDKEAFRSISKECGVRAQPSQSKSYIEQKGMIRALYKVFISKDGGDHFPCCQNKLKEAHTKKIQLYSTRPSVTGGRIST
jgi:hypothetical protein